MEEVISDENGTKEKGLLGTDDWREQLQQVYTMKYILSVYDKLWQQYAIRLGV